MAPAWSSHFIVEMCTGINLCNLICAIQGSCLNKKMWPSGLASPCDQKNNISGLQLESIWCIWVNSDWCFHKCQHDLTISMLVGWPFEKNGILTTLSGCSLSLIFPVNVDICQNIRKSRQSTKNYIDIIITWNICGQSSILRQSIKWMMNMINKLHKHSSILQHRDSSLELTWIEQHSSDNSWWGNGGNSLLSDSGVT